MRFINIKTNKDEVSLKEAILTGVAGDGSLYLPAEFLRISKEDLEQFRNLSFQEISLKLSLILLNEIPSRELEKIIHRSFNFPLPIRAFNEKTYGLELYHGPTLSFKDIGARFMAEVVSFLLKSKEKMILLVATTGDTGSAVGEAFYGRENVSVIILFPKNKVTTAQEKQLTTIGGNVHSIEIEGTFDDCQRLLKMALQDQELKKNQFVSTGNSINVARIIPQSFYFFYALSKLPQSFPIVAVPSGNFGHLVSGIMAKKMDAPIDKFLGVTNINDEVPLFLKTGKFEPHLSIQTIASSMDVGNPSNFSRLCALYHNNVKSIREDVVGMSFTDKEIEEGIKELYLRRNIILEPHSMTGYLALSKYFETHHSLIGLFMETAHPAKFAEAIEKCIDKKIEIPESLKIKLNKPKKSITLSNNYRDLKEFLKVL